MKLGGTVMGAWKTPGEWEALLLKTRFSAVTAPVDYTASREEVKAVCEIARRRNVTIAEVGVWKNPLSPDPQARRAALEYAKRQLAFADEIGVACCVNIAGSAGARWDGAYRENYSAETYEKTVMSIREIIDAVKPRRSFYTIEPMPWMVPDGPDEYLQLIKDVDRPQFAAHMDFANMINCPRRFLDASAFIETCFKKLGPYIKSCHIKDVALEAPFTTMLRETAPGRGALDYRPILRAAHAHMSGGMPMLLEHMDSFEAYEAAFRHLESIAGELGIPIA